MTVCAVTSLRDIRALCDITTGFPGSGTKMDFASQVVVRNHI